MADDTSTTETASAGSTEAAIASMLSEGQRDADEQGASREAAAEREDAERPERTYTQAELDRILGERLNRERASSASQIRELTTKAARLEAIEREQMSEAERLAAERYDAGRADERRDATDRVVVAHVKSWAALNNIGADDLTELLEGMDRARFVTADYEFDESKLAKFLGRFAKAEPAQTSYPDLGQGRRTQASTSTADQFAGAVEGFFR